MAFLIAEAFCLAAGAAHAQKAAPSSPSLEYGSLLQSTPLDNVPYQALGVLATDQIRSDWPNPTSLYPSGGGTYDVLGWIGQSNSFHMAAWCLIENAEGDILYTIPDVVISIQQTNHSGYQAVPGITLPSSITTSSVWPTDPSGAWPPSTVLASGGAFAPSSSAPTNQIPVVIGEGTIPNPDPTAPSCDYKWPYFRVLLFQAITPKTALTGVRSSLTSLWLTSGNAPYQVDGGGGGNPNAACSITVGTKTLSYANCLAPSLSPNGIVSSPAAYTFSSPMGNSRNAPGAMGLYAWSDSFFGWPLNQTELPVPDAFQTSYVLGLESDWGQANNSLKPCGIMHLRGVLYSGQIPGIHTPSSLTAPANLPGPGPWCAAALADNRLQGTMLYDEETGNELYNWSSKRVVTVPRGSDKKPVVANETVACDRTALIPRHTDNTIHIDNIGDRTCNDSGGAIIGYHLDNFVGSGHAAAKSWPHNSEVDVIGCTPDSVSINNSCPAPLNVTGVSPNTPWNNWPAISRPMRLINQVKKDATNREAMLRGLQP